MTVSAADLHEQLSWYWEQHLRPGLAALTDDRLTRASGAGTVGDRLDAIAHLLAQRASFHFGDRSLTDDLLRRTTTAAAALEGLDDAWRAWDAGVLGADQARLVRAHQGPPGTADERYPLWSIVLHVNREVVLLGSQALLLLELSG